jgi:hypothetical protein
MKTHMMSHVKVRSLTTITFVGQIWRTSIEFYVFKLIMGFQQWLAHLLPLN